MWKDYVHTKEYILEYLKHKELIQKNTGRSERKGIYYINAACAFDIETSSFILDELPYGVMYIWMFAVDELFIFGRTWEEFIEFVNYLSGNLELDENNRLVIYVHNLAYEFQFIRKWFTWSDVFALKRLTPVKAVTNNGIEFRCSYMLSGLSLAKTAENLVRHKIKKLLGELDYTILRGRYTELSDNEMEYCLNDVLIVTAYIQEKMESDGDITKIPMTNTGYVRQYCRRKCLQLDDDPRRRNIQYVKTMKSLTLDLETYKRLDAAFAGGFTHANANYVDTTVFDVMSKDFTSSYPTVMVADYFPMSNFVTVDVRGMTEDRLQFYLEMYACVLEVELTELRSIQQEQIISKSKCRHLDEDTTVANNGRIVYACSVNLTCTEKDFKMYKRFYSWESCTVKVLQVARKDYLPTEFVEAILHLYKDKTKLKGNPDKAEEYLVAKGMLNSTYGMSVMKVIREMFEYSNEVGWRVKGVIDVEEEDEDDEGEEELVELTESFEEKQIQKYNKSLSRFLYFPWGVWVTAHARYNLYTAILELGEDYIYSDTDSVKYINPEKHEKYFREYNEEIKRKLEAALDYHGLPYELIYPETIKGEVKPLGVWDDDGCYEMFKALGAKRYLVCKRNKKNELELEMTVAGCSKKKGAEYLEETYGIEGAFDAFAIDLVIPKEYSGRMVHTYSPEEDEIKGTFEDYQGNITPFCERSFIYLKSVPFTVNRSEEFRQFMKGVVMLEEE